ncbi:sigma 54-interacting transcriptional regulator [Nocardiopsis sp. NRRL B-16309]|uniref:sigma 54-interacting transcriptional regulator n=1 Tax=Nocardiopsis sp. NRRL B-16309 TaxID=1519494 RepID=UPI0006AFDAC2|nr:sigma 54-interacting transcriptional regulator [Nocardiopsis sp. NRRL B-16309]
MSEDPAIGPCWFHAVGDGAHTAADQARERLAATGLHLVPWRPGAHGDGVLACAAPDGRVHDLVHEMGRAGRVLVLCLGHEETPPLDAWPLLRHGAADVLPWAGGGDRAVRAVAARLRRWRRLEEILDSAVVRDHLVGRSAVWRSVLSDLAETAAFTDNPVLVTGETGTGKELVARLVNALDRRSGRSSLVLVDCTTITPTLAGSEFFGHEKGSFTGAVGARDGAFALADQGTLFLDEVGELPLELQAELLRVIQEGTYKRVGGNAWRTTRFRLVCATNRDLREHIRQGSFRGDLYYRIAVSRFHLPPLRERPDDILPLAEHFLRHAMPEHERPCFDRAVQDMLVALDYPGNVRELRQLVYRMAARHAGPGLVTVGDVPPDERPDRGPEPLARSLSGPLRAALARGATLPQVKDAVRDELIGLVLAEEARRGRTGALRRAAERLGVSVRTLQMWQHDHVAASDDASPHAG